MTNVLVALKRVPDSSGEVLLTADGQGVDGRYVGFTISNHELCAVELAVQIAGASGGEVDRRDRRHRRTPPSSSARPWPWAARPRRTWSPTRWATAPPTSPTRSLPSSRPTRPRAAATT